MKITYLETNWKMQVLHVRKETSSREQKTVQSWLSVDPMAEKMPEWSSYAYTFNNPVNFTDPTGMIGESVEDRYKLLEDGRIEYYDDKGGETVDYLMDSEGNEIKINNTSLLRQLEKKQNHNGTDVLMASTDSNGKRDMANIFVFIANRSDNEWRMIQTKSNKYILGSKFDPDYSPSSTALGLTGDFEIKNSVHSHPNIYIKPGDSRFLSEQKSMGISYQNILHLVIGVIRLMQ
ncbi:hypothetical protein [Psychroflexus maritimus]|uniref:RHS repeat-associated core domain-containing protein n=1 Tax=Psychroflexus maritimus TaxID=2714865 RepID=A0A967AF42_9FLAO|nr:hypothetical protein [Psychroflexus maritimus]NGZ90398.1 hypothetical protein [Psychroflexus maritimus]